MIEPVSRGLKTEQPLRFSAESLACVRGGDELFSGLGFTLLEGGLLLVTGANGSGKTTLLKILAGLMPPDEGQVIWEGLTIHTPADYEGTALYVGHRNAVRLEATVVENMAFWADMSGNGMLLPAAIHYFQLEPYLHTPCWQLSAGWQRRLALSRLMTCPAPLWLLDEPATNLDAEGVVLLEELIRGRLRQGGLVIMAAHAKVDTASGIAISQLNIQDFIK